MYMLNLVYNLERPDGLLEAYDPELPMLDRSLTWLALDDSPPIDPRAHPLFDPETAAWTDPCQASTILIRQSPDPGWICIRAAHDRRGPAPDEGNSVQIAALFGRVIGFAQPHASPFTDNDTRAGHTVTTFISDPLVPAEFRYTGRAWFFVLRRIVRWPNSPKILHRYKLSVGLAVNCKGEKFYYGEDPEMDISL